ncbi:MULTISPECIES: polyprenyl synthetase family protein [Bartonella]|uniref:Probable farnesyl diphosphate synthase n=1 Tax=Bartonella choladocola TaxID=2750995 RepID=A0A1U9MKW5_9HYPH|nr:farnesyl diphosphate synthase [Bartonella choladocola]AQT48369.1 farnesyl-diphosphate synthase [Bartonella choladocola]MBI0139355.1 polyprenyl synthetase family protein [Bartonella choladocola]
MEDFTNLLARNARQIGEMLDAKLSNHIESGEIARPPRLLAAMRHGVLNGGKRLRPFLVIETARLFDANIEAAQCVGAALEAIHCYSLIHDDLPAMDNDDLRRGKPTVHKAFDEATAILAGDALLTIAFDFLSDDKLELDAKIRLQLINGLARSAGLGGMVGGQVLDLEAETKKPDESGIITLEAMKTGALIRYACEAGAILSNATREDRERLSEFGAAIGLAFQLADDVLDVTADTEALGKTAGKDIAANKATLVALHGVEWAKHQLEGLMEQADSLLEPFGNKADILRATARFVIERKN